jgi:hypothetical protein
MDRSEFRARVRQEIEHHVPAHNDGVTAQEIMNAVDEYVAAQRMLALNEIAEEVHANSVQHGWWGDLSDYDTKSGRLNPEWRAILHKARSFGDIIALIHSEASEALEEYRNGHDPTETYWLHRNGATVGNPKDFPPGWTKPEGVPIEFADIIIRVLDACAAYGIDISEVMRIKMEYNKTRPFKHGGKRS